MYDRHTHIHTHVDDTCMWINGVFSLSFWISYFNGSKQFLEYSAENKSCFNGKSFGQV